jgi:hypothetical protein
VKVGSKRLRRPSQRGKQSEQIVLRGFIRQKWKEAAYIVGSNWKDLKGRLVRKFKLEQWVHSLQVLAGGTEWWDKIQKPFSSTQIRNTG